MRLRRTARLAALLAALAGLTGCGELTIRTRVEVVDESSPYVLLDLPGSQPLPFERGFRATIVMDTTMLPTPIDGSVVIEEIRHAAAKPSLLYLCAWATTNPPTISCIGGMITDLTTTPSLAL